MFLIGFILYGTLCASWTWLTISSSMLGKFSTIIPSKIFSCPFSFSFLFLGPLQFKCWCVWYCLRNLWGYPQCFIIFTLFCSSEVIPTILSSSSLIHSASDILLLIPSRVFLILVIVLFVSVCLFFNYSRSLLIDFCIFSILFSRFLIIFTIIILKYFSGSLPISSSIIWTSVFLIVPSFVQYFSTFSLFFFNLLCLRYPFLRLQGKLN